MCVCARAPIYQNPIPQIRLSQPSLELCVVRSGPQNFCATGAFWPIPPKKQFALVAPLVAAAVVAATLLPCSLV